MELIVELLIEGGAVLVLVDAKLVGVIAQKDLNVRREKWAELKRSYWNQRNSPSVDNFSGGSSRCSVRVGVEGCGTALRE